MENRVGFFGIIGRIYLTLISVYLMLGVSLSGQSYLTHHYSEPDGLPSASVYDITQDQFGRLWFATRAGIGVYDGQDWKHYSALDNLHSLTYVELNVDRYGRVWALGSPNAGKVYVSYFDGEAWNSIEPINVKVLNRLSLSSFELLYSGSSRIENVSRPEKRPMPVVLVGHHRKGAICPRQVRMA